jgi:elongation factor G
MPNASPPVLEIAIEPKTGADQAKLEPALTVLTAEDAALRVTVDHESGQTLIKGTSEEQLAAAIERINNQFGAACRVGAPQVAYRETISGKADIDYTHKKQTGGSDQFARVKIRFEPLPPGSSYQFENAVAGGTIPKGFIPGVEKGLRDSTERGVLAGYPVIDFKATLYDGAYHDVDSSALAFEIAACAAFKEGMRKAEPVLLEPVMRLEVVTPCNYVADVIGDLTSRRGEITGEQQRGSSKVINGVVPLANLFGYRPTLNSLSRGHATYTMAFDHYARMPASIFDPDPRFRPAMGMRA